LSLIGISMLAGVIYIQSLC